MRPDLFLATIGRGSNGSNALEVTEDRAAVTAESQDNIINRVNNISQYGPSWHYVPGIGVAGTAYAEVPGSALGDLAFTRASSKTRTNSAGVVETIGNNVPPHDYRNADGTLSTFPRLNLEPQRTNSIRNSSMVGAVAGTPGTLPTNWSLSGGLAQTIVGTGTENGLPYVDVRLSGTATSAVSIVGFEALTQISASNGQSWTSTLYAKVIAQPTPPLSYNISITERNSSSGFINEDYYAFTPTTSLQRFSATKVLNGGVTTAFVVPRFTAIITNGQTYDFTIRIAAPQMELGNFATTWVPTTTAAVTRIVDQAVKVDANFLPTGYPFTLFSEVHLQDTALNIPISFLNSASSNNYFSIEQIGNIWYAVARPNVTAVSVSATVTTGRGTHKAAAVFTSTTIKLFVNGALIATGANTQAFNSNVNDLLVGQLRTVTDIGGRTPVAQNAIFNFALSDAQCIQMTTL